MKKRHKKFKRLILGVVSVIFATYLISGVVWLISLEHSQKTPAQSQAATRAAPAPLQQDPALVSDAQLLGISVVGVNLNLSETIATDNSQDGKAIGLFVAPNTIEVSSELASHDQLYTFAHEYMHYRWSMETAAQKQAIIPQLFAYYHGDAGFQSFFAEQHYTSAYIDDQSNLVNELDSVECTEVKPSLLPDAVNAYCDSYIPNRAALFQ